MSFKEYLSEARKELLGEESINSNQKVFAMVSKKNDGKFEKWDAKEIKLDGEYKVVTRTVLGDDKAVVIEFPGEGFAVVTDFDLNEEDNENEDDNIEEAVKSDLEEGWFNIPDTESKFGIDPSDVTEFLSDFEVDEGETGEGSFFIEFESANERNKIARALKNIGFKDKQIEKFIQAEED
jgi:hypothetical protein